MSETSGKGLPQAIRVAPERLKGVIQALSYAADEQFDACLELLHAHLEQDQFSELETAFTTFVEELARAKRALKEALGRHEVANRELEDQLRMIELQQAVVQAGEVWHANDRVSAHWQNAGDLMTGPKNLFEVFKDLIGNHQINAAIREWQCITFDIDSDNLKTLLS